MPPSKAPSKAQADARARKANATGLAAAKPKSKGKQTYLAILQAELGGKKGGSTMQVIKRKMKALVPALNEAALRTAIKKGVANGSIVSHGHGSYTILTEKEKEDQGRTYFVLAFHSRSDMVGMCSFFRSAADLKFFNGKECNGVPPTPYTAPVRNKHFDPTYCDEDERYVDEVLELTVLSLAQAKRIVAPLLKPGVARDAMDAVVTRYKSYIRSLAAQDYFPKRAANAMMPAGAQQGDTGQEGLQLTDTGLVVLQLWYDKLPLLVRREDEAALRAYLGNLEEVDGLEFADINGVEGVYTREYLDANAEEIDMEFEMLKPERNPRAAAPATFEASFSSAAKASFIDLLRSAQQVKVEPAATVAIAAAAGNTVVEAGVVAPVDAVVASGMTSLGPEKVSFFQALNLMVGFSGGKIKVLQPAFICKKGDKIGEAEIQLLNLFGHQFPYGVAAEAVAAGQIIVNVQGDEPSVPLQAKDQGGGGAEPEEEEEEEEDSMFD